MAALSSTLDDIRDMFTDADVTGFTDAQMQAVLSILQDPQYGFDPLQNLRFRSSTNVEDSLEFTGAGLYDSYSGCLGDDLDGDNAGPCLCDPRAQRERGVFTAIRKVFASFYNENAYLERLRHGIDEAEVGMAMLVHHSFPDEIELANGVAEVNRDAWSNWQIKLVTQKGATSVTNPEDGSIPEEVTSMRPRTACTSVAAGSPISCRSGPRSCDGKTTTQRLAGLLMKVGDEFAAVTGRGQFTLEMEYKKIAPDGKLIIKQVREIPQPDTTPSITPFLMNEPTRYCVLQGEFGDVFANHRLKSFWRIETGNLWLTEKNLSSCLYGQVSLEYEAEGKTGTLTGRISDWPKAAHSYDESSTTDTWRIGDLENPRTLQAADEQHTCSRTRRRERGSDRARLRVSYARSRVRETCDGWQWPGLAQTTTDQVRLCPYFEPSPQDLLQQRRLRRPQRRDHRDILLLAASSQGSDGRLYRAAGPLGRDANRRLHQRAHRASRLVLADLQTRAPQLQRALPVRAGAGAGPVARRPGGASRKRHPADPRRTPASTKPPSPRTDSTSSRPRQSPM